MVEHRSKVLPPGARRIPAVDEVILGAYLGGMNTRKIRRALEPLLGGAALSKSSISRMVTKLLTFYRYPQRQWKSLRTTNPIERLNEEFRRRTKTQGPFRNESSALVLLWELIAFGYVRLRRIDEWKEMPRVTNMLNDAA